MVVSLVGMSGATQAELVAEPWTFQLAPGAARPLRPGDSIRIFLDAAGGNAFGLGGIDTPSVSFGGAFDPSTTCDPDFGGSVVISGNYIQLFIRSNAAEEPANLLTVGALGVVTLTGIVNPPAQTFTPVLNGGLSNVFALATNRETSPQLNPSNVVIIPADTADPPTVATGAASAITNLAATLNGTADANGASTALAFIYGTDPLLLTGTTTVAGTPATTASDGVAVTAAITGLLPETAYYARARGINSEGATLGEIVTFTTDETPPDYVTITGTLDATAIVACSLDAVSSIAATLDTTATVPGTV